MNRMFRHNRMRSSNRSAEGFTLMELIVVILIIGILVAIAIPSYQQYVTRANRAEARAVLLETSQALERCFTRLNAYNDAGCTVTFPVNSESGIYQVTATTLTAVTYVLTATPTGAQLTRDTLCGNFILNQTGVRTVSGTGDFAACW